METSAKKSSTAEKIAHVREMYEALNAGDVKKSAEHLSDGLVFYSPAFPGPLGKDGLTKASQKILDTTDEYAIELHDILANDDHVVSVFTVHGRRGNRILNERGVHVMHLDDMGRIAEIWAVTDPKPHLDLWGDD